MRWPFLATLFLSSFLLIPETMTVAAEVDIPSIPAGAGALDANPPKEFTTTATGLQYRVLRAGTGINPKSSNTVKVNYHGWLDDGKVFDSSYERGKPIEFPLSGVIPGWTEGMQLVGKGGMIELQIPSKLGYGRRGAPPVIPADAQLHFIVELIEVR